MKSICVFSRDEGSYGSSVILNHLKDVAEKQGYSVSICSNVAKVESDSIIVTHGLWASYKLYKNNKDKCQFSFLVDALSLSISSELKYFLKHRCITIKHLVISLLRWFKYSYQEYVILKHYKKIFLVSAWDKEYYERSFLFRRFSSKIIVIPNGIDIPEKLRGNKAVKKNTIIIGCISAWNDPVYFSTLIFFKRIWCEAVKRNPNLVLRIAGRGLTIDYKKQLLGYPNVELEGEVNSLSDFYNSIDISLITLCKEAGILNKVLEAFSYKVPVLGLKQNFLAFNGIPNCYYVYCDISSFLKRIDCIVNDEEERNNKIELAYSYIKENNNWEKNYLKLISEINK